MTGGTRDYVKVEGDDHEAVRQDTGEDGTDITTETETESQTDKETVVHTDHLFTKEVRCMVCPPSRLDPDVIG